MKFEVSIEKKDINNYKLLDSIPECSEITTLKKPLCKSFAEYRKQSVTSTKVTTGIQSMDNSINYEQEDEQF